MVLAYFPFILFMHAEFAEKIAQHKAHPLAYTFGGSQWI
jgi:hypothetical protein